MMNVKKVREAKENGYFQAKLLSDNQFFDGKKCCKYQFLINI